MLTKQEVELLRDITAKYPKMGYRELQKLTNLSERNIRAFQKNRKVSIMGLTPEPIDVGDILETLIQEQEHKEAVLAVRNQQKVTVNDDKPIAIAFLADFHVGNHNTDYRALQRDIKLIQETEGLFALGLGDYFDNWINKKLQHLQRHQAIPFDKELALCETILKSLAPKLLAMISGNHDLRTEKIAGIDIIKKIMEGVPVLYDPYEIMFKLCHGVNEWKIKIRHSFKGSSIYNASHGQERDLKFGGDIWDIAAQGHLHAQTVLREHVYKNEKKYSLLVGTYKFDDSYGREINCAPSYGSGSACLILFAKEKRLMYIDSVKETAEYLTYLRRPMNDNSNRRCR